MLIYTTSFTGCACRIVDRLEETGRRWRRRRMRRRRRRRSRRRRRMRMRRRRRKRRSVEKEKMEEWGREATVGWTRRSELYINVLIAIFQIT